MTGTSGPSSRSQAMCVLCRTSPSSRKGEHVVPSWLVRLLFPDDPGGYSVSVNGIEQTNRRGDPRRSVAVSRFQLPVCEACNAVLAARFEIESTREAVATLFGVGDPGRCLNSSESRVAAEWLLKTALLLAHESTENSDPGWVPFPYAWQSAPDAVWDWLRNGDPPPDGLSLWIARTSRTDVGDRGRVGDRFLLPTVVVEGGAGETHFLDNSPGISDLSLNLVYHPLWEITHPFLESGECLRLWPVSPSAIDVLALPELTGDRADDFQRLFQPGVRLTVKPEFWESERDPLVLHWEDEALRYPGVVGMGRFSP